MRYFFSLSAYLLSPFTQDALFNGASCLNVPPISFSLSLSLNDATRQHGRAVDKYHILMMSMSSFIRARIAKITTHYATIANGF